MVAGSRSCATLPGTGKGGVTNQVRKREGVRLVRDSKPQTLFWPRCRGKGRRTSDASAVAEDEVLHGCRELELRYIAWKGKGGRNKVRKRYLRSDKGSTGMTGPRGEKGDVGEKYGVRDFLLFKQLVLLIE